MASRWNFLNINKVTYLLSYMENPFFFLTFLSNNVSRLYFEEPGEQVRSLVKSDFLPYPMAVPFRLKVLEML